MPAGQERTSTQSRPDVLTFTTPPGSAVTLFAGTVATELDIVADGSEFDIACTLSRVGSNGRVFAVADGYRRVTVPGMVCLQMRASCLTLQSGEAVRLSVAVAAFPAFPVNPGTGEDPTRARAVDPRIITLHLRHGARLTIGA